MPRKRDIEKASRLHHAAAWFHECAPTGNQGVTEQMAWDATEDALEHCRKCDIPMPDAALAYGSHARMVLSHRNVVKALEEKGK